MKNLPSILPLLLHDLLLLLSFFISNPLILTYFLLLFPYLLKLLFLLYPLLFSTSLLLLLHQTLTFHLHEVCLTDQLCAMLFVDSQNCNLLDGKREANVASKIFQRDGSMRKEKEWKRTLACKLFEERMTYKLCEEREVFDGAEEMDLLWEAYEVDADKREKQRRKEKVEKEEDDDDREKGMLGQFCCLQALKLSAGKMNLGVGRPSLVKVSLALKGISVFNRAGRRRKFNI